MSCSKQFKHCKALFCNFNALKTTCQVHQLQYARVVCRYNSHDSQRPSFSEKLNQGPTFQHFVANSGKGKENYLYGDTESVPYLEEDVYSGHGRKVYFDTYGCQMNFNDTEIAWSILKDKGYSKSESVKEADIVLLMTCSIRDNAEQKIWNMVERYKGFKRKAGKKNPLRIGILGCMAERLKHKILDKEKMVDLVCGPDAYRDLPRLLAMTPESRQSAVNVMLSLEETYADVMPVRINEDSKTAFVSITRGCNNMCSYCIVPFTRGRERSRPISSILEEVRMLSDQGIKEITLLGQNVNSYCDKTEEVHYGGLPCTEPQSEVLSKGFKTIYKLKPGGRRFSHLLDQVSQIDPGMRIRFTSPHPKDFPDEVLYLIRDRTNICNKIHLPAQSGSTAILHAMRRGHTREAYLDLVHHIREIIPDVSLTSDFIVGFCGETEEDHQDTLSLIEEVGYQYVYQFPYSMRQKTHAHHHLKDTVPQSVKLQRTQEVIDCARKGMLGLNQSQIGQEQLVLIEGTSKRSSSDMWGRNDGSIKVIIPNNPIPSSDGGSCLKNIALGDYVVVKILSANSQTLFGEPLYHSSLVNYTATPESVSRTASIS
ncbi:mitochondrial tRNA methylthiotransferase CDK5RAP1-like [Saccostrea echinata]|uniref:mitochondrial tRNA methylthiotransferase CDK5RAP1-like n=1 Tax=Saccostrea echinata TaxID=191078 RepID=UPI002A832786|nr:mitochondrial tRNA methylthiotransferase CDK5RAP1-like [Saccostrea echinata]